MKRRTRKGGGERPAPPKSIEKQVEEYAKVAPEREERVEFLHSGSVMLNLAASQKGRHGGWGRGRVVNLVGDGSSGKTMAALEAAAWSFYNMMGVNTSLFPKVKKIIIVFNNVEGVMDFPIDRMYGHDFVEAVEWIQSPTMEHFGRDVFKRLRRLKKGELMIYICDSLDSLTPQASLDRLDKSLKNDTKEDDSYGTEKAKFLSSSFFDRLTHEVGKKDATLFLISQVRQNIGAGFVEYKRTGGKSLDFYTHQVPWLRVQEKVTATRRGRKRTHEVKVEVNFKRNKLALPYRKARFTIMFNYGIDDIGSMIDWLYGPKNKKIIWGGEKWHKKKKTQYLKKKNAKTYNRETLRKFIIDNGLYDDLVDKVEEEWHEVERAFEVDLPPKYQQWRK